MSRCRREVCATRIRPRARRCRCACYRYIRVSAHVFQGVATTAFVFPLIDLPKRRALIRRWSRKLLRLMRIEATRARTAGEGLPGNLLIVANHISWLDIFVLNTVEPGRFIAKSELKRWPLVGLMIAGCGTLFLNRESRRDAHRINDKAREVLAAGDTITIFPEGTTTDGTTLLPFHGSLLQPVVDAQGHVQSIAIRYCHTDGTYQRRTGVRRRNHVHGVVLARARRAQSRRRTDVAAAVARGGPAPPRVVAGGGKRYSRGIGH